MLGGHCTPVAISCWLLSLLLGTFNLHAQPAGVVTVAVYYKCLRSNDYKQTMWVWVIACLCFALLSVYALVGV